METGILFYKLKDARVLGKVGYWLAAFLNSADRQQAVVVDGRLSSPSPQGTVLGPVLFLLHIADIGKNVSALSATSSYVDDTRITRGISDREDCEGLQEDLATIYKWADHVNMIFNCDKFECIRYWPNQLSKPDFSYTSPDGTRIEEKEHLRDLGVEMTNDLTFSVHITNTVSAANRLVGWTLRTFRRRSRMVMMTIWKSLIQTKLDYTSQLWSPANQGSINELESVARHFTAHIDGMDGLDYWERLSSLSLYSQERRRERYQIIFLWKVAQGLVSGYSAKFTQSGRRGRMMVLPPLCHKAPAAVRRAKEASLQVKGAKLFNCLPRLLRDTMSGTPEEFKANLDSWLARIPDQPTISSRQRAAPTNSLLDQIQYIEP